VTPQGGIGKEEKDKGEIIMLSENSGRVSLKLYHVIQNSLPISG
jgi:hypothetical protein